MRFRLENWKRPRSEVDTLWRLLRVYIRKELPSLQKNNVRLKAIGRLEALPAIAREELSAAERATASNSGLLVNLALNYGGRNELVDAFNLDSGPGARVGGPGGPATSRKP